MRKRENGKWNCVRAALPLCATVNDFGGTRSGGVRAGLLHFIFLFCFASYVVCLPSHAAAQDITANLQADSSHIVIGDFLNVKLTVKFPGELTVKMPSVTDTVGNMELVKASKIDTAISGNFKTLTQTYMVSAYDSGKYHAGPQKIVYKNQSGIKDSIFSGSLFVTVNTVPVDTSKAFKAIKSPVDVPYTLSEFLPYLISAMILIAIIVGAVYYIRRRRKRKPKVIERAKPKDPAHVWARKELKKLEEEKLWQKDEIKQYYSRVTDILRMYLEYRYNWLALESTTEDISEEINSYGIAQEAKQNLLTILNEADLVKFAKRIPTPDSNVKVMEQAYYFLDLTEPKEVKTEQKVIAE